MQSNLKKIITILMLGMSFQSQSMIVYDPVAGALNKFAIGQRVTQLINMARELQNQAAMYTETIKSTQNAITGASFNWDNVEGIMNKLGNVIDEGESLAYSAKNIEGDFKQVYPGYGKNKSEKANYQVQYKKWVNTNQDTMKGTLKSLNLSYKDLQNEKKLKEKLQTQAKTAHGQMEASQVANEMAAEEINQLQKLRQILITNASSQAEYQAFAAQKDAAVEESFNSMLQNLETKIPEYKNKVEFGKININHFKGVR